MLLSEEEVVGIVVECNNDSKMRSAVFEPTSDFGSCSPMMLMQCCLYSLKLKKGEFVMEGEGKKGGRREGRREDAEQTEWTRLPSPAVLPAPSAGRSRFLHLLEPYHHSIASYHDRRRLLELHESSRACAFG